MFQRTYQEFRIAEAKGHIPRGSAFKLTVAALLEGGAKAFHKEYFGHNAWAKEAASVRQLEKEGAEILGGLQESMLSDLSSTRSVLRAGISESGHVTTDFPLILASLRQRSVRDGYEQADSSLAGLAELRPVSDFRLIQGVTISNFEDLEVQPENEDVDYASFEYTKDQYRVAMYAKAFKFNYQMWKNDDYGLLMRVMKKAGRKARRLRDVVVADAIIAGTTRVVYGGSAGGPEIDRLNDVITKQGDLVVNGERQPRRVTDLLLPLSWQTLAQSTLNSQTLNRTGDKAPTANPVLGAATPKTDIVWSEKAGRDWIAYDRNEELVELSVLDDFEAGPLTITKLADVGEHPEMGAFSDNGCHIKWCDACGASMTPEGKENAVRVKGD